MSEIMINDRLKLVHEKGFDFGAVKVGDKIIESAILDLQSLKKAKETYVNKGTVIRALYERDVPELRRISNYFYRTNGIYQRACDYLAYLYRYDWYIVADTGLDEKINKKTTIKDYMSILKYLDNSRIKLICGDMAAKVIKNGAYYGYKISNSDRFLMQELPVEYCRSRFIDKNGQPVVEFNMRFFDEKFPATEYRAKVLNMFPKEFQKGYALYRLGKLPDDCMVDIRTQWRQGWYALDINNAFKISFTPDDTPFLVSTVPYLLDLDMCQELDRLKQMLKLSKILIQKLPIDKNGDLVFDIDEAKDLHDNAVKMVSGIIGADVMTTFADIDAIDMSDSNTSARTDELERIERAVYNNMGLSKNIFNADGNLALSNSILNDESTMRTAVLQFESFFNSIVQKRSLTLKKYTFTFYMLETTQYNYINMSKLYKELTQLGDSKLLPQIALGHSQSSIINAAFFENNVLDLTSIMIPPISSSTMNAETLQLLSGKKTSNNETSGSDKAAGRPTNEEKGEPVSDKTILNLESLN